jgi:hypothetical protein
MLVMDEQANQLGDAPAQEPAPERNRGQFRPGDVRINRRGRPRTAKAADQEEPADRAPSTDRLMVMYVPAPDLAHRLSHQSAPWIVNLPEDFEIVGSRVDAARAVVALVIRSKMFLRIAQGAVIPELKPRFNGLRWQRG